MGDSDRTIICPFCKEQRDIPKNTRQDICPRCLLTIEYDIMTNLAWDRGPSSSTTKDQPSETCPSCHQTFMIIGTEYHITCPNCFHKWHRGVDPMAMKVTQLLGTIEPKEGLKDDQNKLRWDLFPAESAEQIIKVLMFGATKYDPWNWSKGIKFTRLFAAMMRHMWSWYRRQTNDPETGLNHLAHAACTLVFLLSYSTRSEKFQQQFDDRPNYLVGVNNDL
jgi:hypothetical protein